MNISDDAMCWLLSFVCLLCALIAVFFLRRLSKKMAQATPNRIVTVATQPLPTKNVIIAMRIRWALSILFACLIYWFCNWSYGGEALSTSPLLVTLRFLTGMTIAWLSEASQTYMLLLKQYQQCANAELTLNMNWVTQIAAGRSDLTIRVSRTLPWIVALALAPNMYFLGAVAGSLCAIIAASAQSTQTAQSHKSEPNK